MAPTSAFVKRSKSSRGRFGSRSGHPDGYGRPPSTGYADESSVRIRGHCTEITCMAWHPDGEICIAADKSGRVVVWSMKDRVPRRTLCAHTDCVNDLKFSPNSSSLASADIQGRVVLWKWRPTDEDETKYTVEAVLRRHVGSVNSVLWRGNKMIWTAGDDCRILLWDVSHKDPDFFDVVLELREHSLKINMISSSMENDWLISVSDDESVVVWNTSAKEHQGFCFQASLAGERLAHVEVVRCCAMDLQGNRIVTAGDDEAVLMWKADHDFHDSKNTAWEFFHELELPGYVSTIWGMAWAPHDPLLAMVEHKGVALIWNLEGDNPAAIKDYSLIRELRGHEAPVKSLAWSTDGKQLATAGRDRKINVWSLAERKSPVKWRLVKNLGMKPDGRPLSPIEVHRRAVDHGDHGQVLEAIQHLHEGGSLEEAKELAEDGTLNGSGNAEEAPT
eukprot:TRINITY_DN22250_c0_g1_i1.p1 TRINITY_DN22250_c0_g1~~TRINITY_DN22250_c0_g1_i1.p1  ORF type:complete len:447 (+),score=69.48 TRINITY_DN22250_c0_g1_i1:144-1484(+)